MTPIIFYRGCVWADTPNGIRKNGRRVASQFVPRNVHYLLGMAILGEALL